MGVDFAFSSCALFGTELWISRLWPLDPLESPTHRMAPACQKRGRPSKSSRGHKAGKAGSKGTMDEVGAGFDLIARLTDELLSSVVSHIRGGAQARTAAVVMLRGVCKRLCALVDDCCPAMFMSIILARNTPDQMAELPGCFDSSRM